MPEQVWYDLAVRAVARDTLLQLAAKAEAALDVTTNKGRGKVQPAQGATIFQTTFGIFLRAADEAAATDNTRAKHLGYAADLLEFCEKVGSPLASSRTALELRMESHELLSHLQTRFGSSTDLTAEVMARGALGRSYRLAGLTVECDAVLNQEDTYFYRTGAEHLHWEFQAERLANLISAGQAAQASGLDDEADVWNSQPLAADWPTERRSEQMRSLADLAEGKLNEARRRLDLVVETMQSADLSGTGADGQPQRVREVDATQADIRRISVLLSHADVAAAQVRTGIDPGAVEVVVQDLTTTLDMLARLRLRWRVVARSRSPLARAFRRIYGEIALIAASLGTPECAEIGLRVALAVKQTGFAQLLRSERATLDEHFRKIMSRIVTIEDQLARSSRDELADDSQLRTLDRWNRQIQGVYSPLLAQLAIPSAADLGELSTVLGGRDALDFVTVDDVYGRQRWFRTWLRSGHARTFESFELGEETRLYLFGGSGSSPEPARREWLTGTSSADVMWRAMARELIPAALLTVLAETPPDDPLKIVISPHDAVGLIPWPTLHVDEHETLIVDVALLTQIPVLTFLASPHTEPVGAGSALTWLDPSVITIEQRRAWSPDYPDEPMATCDLTSRRISHQPGTVLTALDRPTGGHRSPWQLVHITCHGEGVGLAQSLNLTGGQLLAGRAIGLLWPEAVVLAACYAGRVENPSDIEPIGFVTAVMAGGARTVLAGLLNISAAGTEALLKAVVPHIRPRVRLEEVLRTAQRAMREEDVTRWALMTAFVR